MHQYSIVMILTQRLNTFFNTNVASPKRNYVIPHTCCQHFDMAVLKVLSFVNKDSLRHPKTPSSQDPYKSPRNPTHIEGFMLISILTLLIIYIF
jgi:hypothetical protein